jgi:threonylcarbamoyladenosine tRNA methylthiotransferase MtaB
MSTESKPATEIVTFGCRLNAFESEVMRGHARDAGLGDSVVINTCAVTSEAMRQAAQMIRKTRRERPDARIIVTGCAAQIEPQRFADMPEVDHVLGNGEKMRAESWRGLVTGDSAEAGANDSRVQVADIMALTQTAHHLIGSFGARSRAYVEVQNGCDHRCTFCIIPYGRGPSRSQPIAAVIEQVRRLVEGGTSEVVLTGVDMTSWGSDLGADHNQSHRQGQRLGDLVRAVLADVPDLKRLRLSSIDSIEADEALVRAMAEEERLMPHLHLSLQAGDDMILKRMKRRHLRADSIAFCAEMRRLRPDIVFGADLIAGFPTETDAMFANSDRLIEDCGLTYLHIFPFSARPGTPAARMPAVERVIVKERAARLRARGDMALAAFLDTQIGQTRSVLIEKDGMGRTPQFAEMQLSGAVATGRPIVTARVTGRTGARLTGEVVA